MMGTISSSSKLTASMNDRVIFFDRRGVVAVGIITEVVQPDDSAKGLTYRVDRLHPRGPRESQLAEPDQLIHILKTA